MSSVEFRLTALLPYHAAHSATGYGFVTAWSFSLDVLDCLVCRLLNERAKFLHGAAGKTAFAVYLCMVLAEDEDKVIGGFYEH